MSRSEQVIVRNNVITDGHIDHHQILINVPDSSTAEIPIEVTFPFDVEILSGVMYATGVVEGDKAHIYAEIGQVGTVAVAQTSGNDTVELDETAIAQLYVGAFVTFAADTKQYRIKSIDTTTNVITLTENLEISVSATDAVNMFVEFVPPAFELVPERIPFGNETATGSYLPAGKKFHVKYTPVSGAARTVRAHLVYLY